MAGFVSLKASDGHVFSAYQPVPIATPRGGLVVLQEVFGVNEHIRSVADRYAAEGYRVLAPALFDRVEKDAAFSYTDEGRERGRRIRTQIPLEVSLIDIAATVAELSGSGKVGVVGYCLGGILAWLSAGRLSGIAAASCYYPSGIGNYADERPRCPVQLHFAENDHSVSLDDVAKVKLAQSGRPEVEPFVYAGAAHGFNCDLRSIYHPEASALAGQRTLAFFRKHIG